MKNPILDCTCEVINPPDLMDPHEALFGFVRMRGEPEDNETTFKLDLNCPIHKRGGVLEKKTINRRAEMEGLNCRVKI